MTTDAARRLQAIRDVLESGRPDFAIQLGSDLRAELTDPTDLAVLHFLVGRAEIFNGRVAPAMQRFRLADHPGLSAADRLRLGLFEAFMRYQSGGVDAVAEVVDEIETQANGDAATLSVVKAMRSWVLLERGLPAEALPLALAAQVEAGALADHELIVLSWMLLSIAYYASGRDDDSGRAASLGIEHAKSSGHGLALPLLHVSAADVDLRRGRLAHATLHARSAIESSEPMSAGLVGAWGHGVLGNIADRTGDERAAADHVLAGERALLRGAPLGWGQLAVARLRVDRHRDPLGAAQRLLDVWQYMEDAGSSGYPIMFCLPVAELSARLQGNAIVDKFARRVDAMEAANPMDDLVVQFCRSIFRLDLATSIRIVDRIVREHPTALAVVGDCTALVADVLDTEADRRTRSFAAIAHDAYQKMGANGDVARLLARHQFLARPEDRTMSPAEQRVVSLLVAGKTNAEIASELTLSIKTVESHLARVYRRVGVKSRTQLVSRLRESS